MWNKILVCLPAAALGASLVGLGAEAPRPRQPMRRDLTTGYLLNSSFLSPRPYCWPREDFFLSGWDVDRRGGHLEFSPNCRYPEGFGFHSDWFKVVDTSTNAAVVLEHQIARQTEGMLTLEFRFKLPRRMDGAGWQLRDLTVPAVSLLTADGHLCSQPHEGRPIPLLAVQDGRDYGVKVIADLDRQQADVYVDGALRASGLRFANPVKSVDVVRVQTGLSGTGEMFVNPVNVFKGYLVNETFVTCAPGQAPSNWKTSAATVRAFECGTKPDVLSLRLAGAAEHGAEAATSFAPVRARTVFEARILLPTTGDGFQAQLGSGLDALRVATVGGSLCLPGPELAKTLVPNYRTNLWYMLKVVADPQTGFADVWVNGKAVATRRQFSKGNGVFDEVRFQTTPGATAWVDDVRVYRWREYPPDYVPAPKPAAPMNGLLLGVQSCNLWREGTAYAGWDYVYPYRDKREPYLGWYDEGDAEETDWEIKWQVEHGIGFEQHCWYRPNNAINHPIKDGVLDHGIIQGLFNARYSDLARFTIMFTNEGAGETNPTDWRENIIPYWIEYFFKDPRYLKVDGRPVLAIYHLGHFLRMFEGVTGATEAIRTLREEVAAAGFPGIVVLMEDRTANPDTLKTMKALGVDYCYAYTWGTPDSAVQQKMNRAQRDAAAKANLRSLTSLSMGWDREAWGVREGGWLPVSEYEALANWARDEFMPSLPSDSLGRRMVMLANWNEFGEGHFLMPSTLAGFGYVDALRRVFTAGGAHEDVRPSREQRQRFTVLYPRD